MKLNKQSKHVRRSDKFSSGGFSLVEMLVVIAVVGMITAIAVPTIGGVTREANEAKARRNAQNLAAMGAAAMAVGFEFASSTKEGAAEELVAGVNGAGEFVDHVFRVPNLSGDELTKALHYVRFENSMIIFRADHSHNNP